ncbi:MAG: hypothetical protein Q8M35_01835, partial [Pseudohongiella sp.]|nr:hypothetical protein [Pseudohongiella sp.]
MNSDNYSAYCKEHADEFRDELRDDASRALRNWPGRTAAFLLIVSSFISWLSMSQSGNPDANKVLFTYALPVAIAFGYPLASLLFARLDKYSRSVLDVFLLSILFGFCLTLHFVFKPIEAGVDPSDL